MRIVLGEASHPGQSMQFPVLLVAVHRPKLRQSKREILVRAGLGLVNLAVMGAVHGLEQVLFPFVRCKYGPERILAVFVPMPRGLVQLLVPDMRGYHLHITRPDLLPSQKLLQDFADHGPLGQPQREPHAHLLTEGK